MIVIIGAGIAGLSAALHLVGREHIIIEKEADVGGLCRSKKIDGFCFDYTGHLLHFRDPLFSSFLEEHFSDVFAWHERRSFIFSHGTYLPYPFQINTFGLPRDVVFECLYGFVKALRERKAESSGSNTRSETTFKDWILQSFGEGFARHFFIPFNEKLYCRDLMELSSEWTGWSIPVPSIADVVAGAVGIRKTGVGYNPRFLYPKSGGIDILPRRIASSCSNILLNSRVVAIDFSRKKLCIEGGKWISYDRLISTIPLKALLKLCADLPDEIRGADEHLDRVMVLDISIGLEGKLDHDRHWIYFPERDIPFYRVGFPSNFSNGVTPDGCSSIYVEVALRSGEKADIDAVAERSIESLLRLKIINDEKRIIVRDVDLIDPAYVVFDFYRRDNLERIVSSFEKMGIITAGRFGSWDYLSMEGAFLDGRKAAERAASTGR